jgi:hypothetical protein
MLRISLLNPLEKRSGFAKVCKLQPFHLMIAEENTPQLLLIHFGWLHRVHNLTYASMCHPSP